jgi:hypothetical protein
MQPPAGQPVVYRPAGVVYVIYMIAAAIPAAVGVGLLTNVHHTRWLGTAIGVLLILVAAFTISNALTRSVAIHEQGLVIRQNLHRRFVPWQAVVSIKSMSGTGGAPLHYVVLQIRTGVNRPDRYSSLGGTAGSKKRVEKIVAEMDEFQRGAVETASSVAQDEAPSA